MTCRPTILLFLLAALPCTVFSETDAEASVQEDSHADQARAGDQVPDVDEATEAVEATESLEEQPDPEEMELDHYYNAIANGAYKHGRGNAANFPASLKYYLMAADAGIPNAQFYAGRMYYYGHGTERDYAKAIKYYKMAAANDEVRAWNNLGYMAEHGYGGEIDQKQALEYYEKSSELGMAMASVNASRFYRYGKAGLPKDYAIAEEYLRLAIKQYPNYGDALNSLGDLYFHGGPGLKKNHKKALFFYARSLENKDKYAMRNIGLILRNGELGEPDLASAEWHFQKGIEMGDAEAANYAGNLYYYDDYAQQDYAKALAYYEQAAAAGADPDHFKMGWIYKSGPEELRDYDKAFAQLRISADNGNPYGLRSLGYCYAYGYGVDVDRDLARDAWLKLRETDVEPPWFELGYLYERNDYEHYEPQYAKAREYYLQGIEANGPDAPKCALNLGYLYRTGRGVKCDPAKAVTYFQLAIDGGNARAHNSLGYSYVNGIGVDQDFAKALEHFELAYEQGYIGALDNLGFIYENGKGVPVDFEKAAEYYRLGIEADLPYSANSLGMFHLKKLIANADRERGMELLTMAAEQNDSDSIDELIAIYTEGRYEVAPDEEKAAYWTAKKQK